MRQGKNSTRTTGCFYLNLDSSFSRMRKRATHIYSARNIYGCNPLFRPTISGLCAMLPVQNATYFFFLVSPDFVGTFGVWICVRACVCVCTCGCYRSLHYGSNSVIFSDFSPRMFVNVLLFRKRLARKMSFILGNYCKDTHFLFCISYRYRKRTSLGHC